MSSLSSANSRKRKKRHTVADPGDWQQWTDYLECRHWPTLVDIFGDSKRVPWFWGWTPDPSGAPSALKRLWRVVRGKAVQREDLEQQLATWIERFDGDPPDGAFALESVAWAAALPRLSAWLPATPWNDLLKRLLRLAEESAGLPLESQSWLYLLLHGELPWTLGQAFPELPECTQAAEAARTTMSNAILELLDGEGLLHARHVAVARRLLACWTRCILIGRRLDLPLLHRDAQLQYEWLVRQSLRLTRPNGSALFGDDACWEPRFLETALRIDNDPADRAASRRLSSRKKGKDQKLSASVRAKLPEPSVHSEWSELGVLRGGWEPDDPLCGATFHNRQTTLELVNRGLPLIAGQLRLEVSASGGPLVQATDWEVVCWHSDHDIDYLELESKWTGGYRVQRQLALVREEPFLFLADAVLGDTAQPLQLQLTLPLADGVEFRGEEETSEGFLAAGRKRRLARVVPLALPEWRVSWRNASLVGSEQQLTLVQAADQASLYAPLLLDLSASRSRKGVTWRHLTVAERLRIVRPDEAVAYRVQIGKRQWVVYRSLTRPESRSFLGLNHASEFLLARFQQGEIETLVEIE